MAEALGANALRSSSTHCRLRRFNRARRCALVRANMRDRLTTYGFRRFKLVRNMIKRFHKPGGDIQ
jgi:hypothetical protein